MAVRRAMGRARSLARRVAARLVRKPGTAARSGIAATYARPEPRSRRGGGLAIEMWRAEDDGVAVAESQLQADVFDQLAAEPLLDSTDIRVDVDRRTVRLSGTVKTSAERVTAERAAKRLTGGERVDNEIMVARPVASR